MIKMTKIITVLPLCVLLTCLVAKAEEAAVAQCLYNAGKLNISTPVRTVRGNEFFAWEVLLPSLANLFGTHPGSTVTNLFDQATRNQNFVALISSSATPKEISIEIQNTDLSPLSDKKNFKLSCQLIAY